MRPARAEPQCLPRRRSPGAPRQRLPAGVAEPGAVAILAAARGTRGHGPKPMACPASWEGSPQPPSPGVDVGDWRISTFSIFQPSFVSIIAMSNRTVSVFGWLDEFDVVSSTTANTVALPPDSVWMNTDRSFPLLVTFSCLIWFTRVGVNTLRTSPANRPTAIP